MKHKTTKIPLGKALNTDEFTLDILALVTPEDIEAAKADAARNMTRRGQALLETIRAEPQEEQPLA